MSNEENSIRPEMTVLDVVSRYRQTQAVFRKYEKDDVKFRGIRISLQFAHFCPRGITHPK